MIKTNFKPYLYAKYTVVCTIAQANCENFKLKHVVMLPYELNMNLTF